ncbi:MAG: HdeD family acid-resistance protein [Stappiaceae bacterium]
MTEKTDADINKMAQSITQSVQENWGWFLGLGILLLLIGMFAIAAPLASTLAVTIVLAAALVIGGIFQIIHAFKVQKWSGFIWQLIVGLIAVVGGIIIYTNPVAGALTLTLLVAAIFFVQGISQVILGFRIRPHDGWGWMLASGVISAVAGLAIWGEFPISGAWALGMLAGIAILFNGWSYIAIALAAKASRNN